MGLYLNPPEHALVLCVHEKSQIHALDRNTTDLAAAAGCAAVPEEPDIHLVMDNYGTHKMPKVRHWFVRRPGTTCTLRPPAPAG